MSLPTEAAHQSGGMSQSKAVDVRPDTEEVEGLGSLCSLGGLVLSASSPLFPGQAGVPCYDVLPFHKQAFIQHVQAVVLRHFVRVMAR